MHRPYKQQNLSENYKDEKDKGVYEMSLRQFSQLCVLIENNNEERI